MCSTVRSSTCTRARLDRVRTIIARSLCIILKLGKSLLGFLVNSASKFGTRRTSKCSRYMRNPCTVLPCSAPGIIDSGCQHGFVGARAPEKPLRNRLDRDSTSREFLGPSKGRLSWVGHSVHSQNHSLCQSWIFEWIRHSHSCTSRPRLAHSQFPVFMTDTRSGSQR